MPKIKLEKNILAYTASNFSRIFIIVTSQLQLNFSWGDTKIGLQVLCSCTSSSHTNFQSKLLDSMLTNIGDMSIFWGYNNKV